MNKTVLFSALLILLLLLTYSSCVTKIPPHAQTLTAITETSVRIELYLKQQGNYPQNLSTLPIRQGYANRTHDAYGRPLLYSVDPNGVIEIKSYGQDGVPGGDGPDEDIIKRYRSRNSDGTLNNALELLPQ